MMNAVNAVCHFKEAVVTCVGWLPVALAPANVGSFRFRNDELDLMPA